ncbi:MAG: hypothetical protein [Olavius algarvensis Delta 4 endosymbiont]|nr:MAG: hypothetical protein [Olavius algarvensis Delta 4 endosymbiont]
MPCHAGEGRDPERLRKDRWMPAFAGMAVKIPQPLNSINGRRVR